MNGVVPVTPTRAFQKQLGCLSERDRGRVEATIHKLSRNPTMPGLNVERVRAASRRIRTCRVSDRLRLLFEQAGDGLRLLAVGEHDSIYRSAPMYLLQLLNARDAREAPEEEVMGLHDLMEEQWPEDLDGIWEEFGESIQDVIDQGLSDGIKGKATPFALNLRAAPAVNVIPTVDSVACTPVLVAFCFDEDQFRERLHEVEIHAGISCPGTRLIVLVTTQWMPVEWRQAHASTFGRLNAHLLIYFAGFGELTPILL